MNDLYEKGHLDLVAFDVNEVGDLVIATISFVWRVGIDIGLIERPVARALQEANLGALIVVCRVPIRRWFD